MFERFRKKFEPPRAESPPFIPRPPRPRLPEIKYQKHTIEPLPEGRVYFDRQPGEIDRGSNQHRIGVLIKAIRMSNNREHGWEPDGWY